MATTNSTTQPMGLAPAMNFQLQGQTLKNMDCVAVYSPPPPLWLHAGLAQSSPLMPNSAPCPHGFRTNKTHSTSSDAQFQTNPPPFTSALTSTPEANGGSDYEMIRQECYPESYTAAFTGFQTCSFMNMEPFLDQHNSPTGPQVSIEFTGELDLVEECASPDLSQNKIGPICTIATKNEVSTFPLKLVHLPTCILTSSDEKHKIEEPRELFVSDSKKLSTMQP